MNMIRERILTDTGFTNNPEDANRVDTHDMKIAKLEAALHSLSADLRNRDKHWESVRNTDLIKAVDKIEGQERELATLRKEHDRALKKARDLELELERSKQELLLAKEAIPSAKQPVKGK